MSMKKLLIPIALATIIAGNIAGCPKSKPKPVVRYITVKGNVFNEKYMPASGGWNSYDSRYSFSMNTEIGKKAVQVRDHRYKESIDGWDYWRRLTKESIDSLINEEERTEVEVKIKEENKDNQIYAVSANRIKVN